ncbi:MAG: virulence factor family protein [Syntrophaceae bacterium]|nr:virulence factor family protein [Syntrophaceae bacterium]
MKRLILGVFILLSLLTHSLSMAEEYLFFGRFGRVTVYRESRHPSQVVLFVSGDGGWNKGVIDMAKALASLGVVVVGIDISHYLKELRISSEKCSYAAADFEMLSKFIQKKLDFPNYVPPILVGYSSGATLVYAILVQAPPNTFHGAISLGFCPDLPLTKPLCRGYGLEWKPGSRGRGYSFVPASNLQTPWIAFQGTIDQVCNVTAVQNYVRQVKEGKIVLLPKVGHGFAVQRNWMPQFRQVFISLVERHKINRSSFADELKDLPLVEVLPKDLPRNSMAVILSGDGGWAGIDRELGNILAGHGIPVVGLNSLQYFWTRRTPDESARDLGRILRHYFDAWKMEKAILIGYLLGADVLPFMVNRLPQEILTRIQGVALLGPGDVVDFEFHLTDWLGVSSARKGYSVLPEVERLKGVRILCFYGEEEKHSLCKKLRVDLGKVIPLKGGHHFGGDYEAIAETILNDLK